MVREGAKKDSRRVNLTSVTTVTMDGTVAMSAIHGSTIISMLALKVSTFHYYYDHYGSTELIQPNPGNVQPKFKLSGHLVLAYYLFRTLNMMRTSCHGVYLLACWLVCHGVYLLVCLPWCVLVGFSVMACNELHNYNYREKF